MNVLRSNDKWVPVTTSWRFLRFFFYGGTASNMEGRFEYIEKALADSRQGVVLQLRGGLGEVLTIANRENVYCYDMFTQKTSDLD